MVTRLRLWSLTRWVIVLASFVVSVVVAVVVIQLFRDRTWLQAAKTGAPVGAVLVALLSLIATSVSLAANWRRQRRESTLRAWTEWSHATTPIRKRLTTRLGSKALSEAVGKALAEDKPIVEGEIDLTDDAIRQKVINNLVMTLNGLERMAVGVETGVFDLQTLRKLGGTIIVRQWDRADSYIQSRRSLADATRRQKKAFVALEELANQLERHSLKEKSNDLDRKRLAILKRR